MLLFVALTLLLEASAAGGAGSTPEPEVPGNDRIMTELREDVLVRRVRWPVRFLPRKPGGCDDIRPEQLEVREDGVAVRPEALERTRMETIHAILIDASGSMHNRLGLARDAAGEYIDGLPTDEPVLLASFSDNLVLHAPLTRDRARLARALDGIDVRIGTAFNDAMYYLIRYLQSRPERKVVVVLTDGCDTTSLRLHPIRRVLQLAEETPNLAVFPIGMDLPRSCDGIALQAGPAVDAPVLTLDRLARRSGARLFKTKAAAALGDVFREIRARLDQEGFVTYVPPAFGDAPRDGRRGATERSRRVRVRSTVERTCRVVSSGPAMRREHAAARPPEDVLQVDDPLRLAFGERLPFEDWWQDSAAAPAHLYLEAGTMRGRAADILGERAALYAPIAYWLIGKYRTVPDGRVELGQRDFSIEVPPFDVLRDELTSPSALLLHLLERGRSPFAAPDLSGSRRERATRELDRAWLHGQTLLELRRQIGLGLFSYAGYREFAARRLRDEYREDVRRALEDARRAGEIGDERMHALLAAVDAQPRRPEPGQVQRVLAEWLGDLSARELVVGFESWAANRVLDASRTGEPVAGLLRLVDERWPALPEWFPPPTRVRVIAPLVPAFDPDRQVVGFYRIVLPNVDPWGPPLDAVPPAPLGLTFVRHVVGALGADRAADALQRVRAISYDDPPRRVRRRLVRGAKKSGLLEPRRRWRELPMVRVQLGVAGASAPGSSSTVLTVLTVLYEPAKTTDPPGGPRVPLCVHVDGVDPAGPPASSLHRALFETAPACDPSTVPRRRTVRRLGEDGGTPGSAPADRALRVGD